MNNLNIVFLIDADGYKGRNTLDLLCKESDFHKNQNLKVVLDNKGKAIKILEKHMIEYIVTSKPRNPSDSILELFDSTTVDFIISCGWSYKIPDSIISMANLGALNCHSSFLPSYRGAAVHRVQWAHAEAYGGVTIHYLTNKFDEGNIIVQKKYPIGLFDTPLDIARKNSACTADIMLIGIEKVCNGYPGEAQKKGTYYSKQPWIKVMIHSLVNHVSRCLGFSWRWRIKSK